MNDELDPRLLEAATALFQDEERAIEWLQRPVRGLGYKRPVDVDIDEVLDLISRFRHGFLS